MESAIIILIAAIIIVVTAFAIYYATQVRFERRFRHWQENQQQQWQALFEQERQQAALDKEQTVKTALTQSRAVLGGKFTEQMTPYLPQFRYDPTEARFIGSPIDFIVFPGLAAGEPQEIVIMEVKTGKSALTPAQRKIRQLIEDGMVRWEQLSNPGG